MTFCVSGCRSSQISKNHKISNANLRRKRNLQVIVHVVDLYQLLRRSHDVESYVLFLVQNLSPWYCFGRCCGYHKSADARTQKIPQICYTTNRFVKANLRLHICADDHRFASCPDTLFVRCVLGLLAVPHRSITFLFLIHSGDCAWCRQGEHGPLGRVLITLNLPLGLAATERRIPTRPPILPALYEGDPLPA